MFRENKPSVQTGIGKDDGWSICQLSYSCTSEYAQTNGLLKRI